MDRAVCLSSYRQKLITSLYCQTDYANKELIYIVFYTQILMIIDTLDFFQNSKVTLNETEESYNEQVGFRFLTHYIDFLTESISRNELHLVVSELKGTVAAIQLFFSADLEDTDFPVILDTPKKYKEWSGGVSRQLKIFSYLFKIPLSSSHVYKLRLKDADSIWPNSSSLSQNQVITLFRQCYSCVTFPIRACIKTSGLTLRTAYEFREFNRGMDAYEYDDDIIDDLSEIMYDWLKDVDYTEVNFRHGSGATTTVKRSDANILDKTLDFYDQGHIPSYRGVLELLDLLSKGECSLDYVNQYKNKKDLSLENYRIIGESLVEYQAEYIRTFDRLMNSISSIRDSSPGLMPLQKPSCRFQTVPKTVDKLRGISVEPSLGVWLQEGIADLLMDFVHSNTRLRSHLDMKDQERNRALALQASEDNEFVTLDLSSASDSVSLRLVLGVFSKLPILQHLLLLPRSDRITINIGNTLEEPLRIFGGMGNATTFKVETLIFGSIIESVIRKRKRQVLRKHGKINRKIFTWSVYGDDIIVHRSIADEVISLLSRLNFKINVDKSFCNDEFYRESCGIEAIYGFDVTPLKISRKLRFECVNFVPLLNKDSTLSNRDLVAVKRLFEKKAEPQWANSIIQEIDLVTYATERDSITALVNELYKYSFKEARKFLIKTFCKFPFHRSFEPLFTDISVGNITLDDQHIQTVGSGKELFSPMSRKINKRLQRFEVVQTSVSLQKDCELLPCEVETILFYCSLFSKKSQVIDEPFVLDIKSSKAKLSVPIPKSNLKCQRRRVPEYFSVTWTADMRKNFI